MNRRTEKLSRRPPLTEEQKLILFIMLTRSVSLFSSAVDQLNDEHFLEQDAHFRLLWGVLRSHYAETAELPDYAVLATELQAVISAAPESLSDAGVEALERFLDVAFSSQFDPERFNPNLMARYLRWFLEDSLVERARDVFMGSTWSPSDLTELTTGLAEEAQAIQAIGGGQLDVPFPEGWDGGEAVVEKWPTGCDFIDYFLGGGDSPGEVYGLMGPFGSCKTTTIIQLATRRAEWAYSRWHEGGRQGPMPVVYYMFWEGTMGEARVRSLSTLGQLFKSTLAEGRWETLSTCEADLKDYERRMFARQLREGAPVWPEVVRKTRAERILNRNYRIVDMTGNDPNNPGRGSNLTADIVAVLRQDQQRAASSGRPICCAGVYIDYLIAAIDAYAGAHKVRQEDISRLVKRVPLALKNKVAVAFRCPVWVIQQLSGEANALSPGSVPKITDSAEGKSFAENLDFCFQYGGRTPEMRCVLACGKQRREKPRPEIVVQIDGDLATVRSTNGEYVLDAISRRIVSREELSRVNAPQRSGREDAVINISSARTQVRR